MNRSSSGGIRNYCEIRCSRWRLRTNAPFLAGTLAACLCWAAPPACAQVVGESHTRIHDPEAEALQQLLADGQAALDRKDFAAAAQKYHDYLAKKPEDAAAHFQLGYALTAMHRPAEAKSEYAKAAELDPMMVSAYLNLGMTDIDIGDASSAIAPLEKAAELSPSEARPRLILGLAYEKTGKLGEAIEQLQAAEKLDDKSPGIHEELGRALLASNRAGDAEAEFRATIALRPDSSEAHLGLARSLIAEKKSADAAAEIDVYLKSEPNDSTAHIERASLLIDAGKYEDALTELDRVRSAGGGEFAQAESLRALKLRAEADLNLKRYDAAIAALEKGEVDDPHDAQIPAALGHAYIEKKDYPSAIRALGVAWKMDTKSDDVLGDLINAQYLSKNYQAALQGIDLLSQRKQLPVGSWFVRATCYDKLGEAAQALDAYEKFLQLNTDETSDMYFEATARVRFLKRQLEKKR